MKNAHTSVSSFWIENKQKLTWYLYLIGIAATVMTGYLVVGERFRILGALLLPVVTLVIITRPKWAVYQFIFFICTNYVFWREPVILYVDLSAVLLILTAVFDILLKGEASLNIPKMTLNFVMLISVFILVSIFGYNPVLGINPLLRIVMLTATFLSLYRLSSYFTIQKILTLFFWIAVFHATIALLPYIGAGKIERVFGFAKSTLDDLMVLAIPIGIVFYLRAEVNRALIYSGGVVVVILTLIATQSRLSIIFAIIAGLLVVYLTRFKLRTVAEVHLRVKRRTHSIIGLMISAIVLIAVLAPEMVSALLDRYNSLLTSSPSETFLVRLVLWQNALTTFWDHPFLGIGLGHYQILSTIYHPIHLHFMYQYIQGYSAHNMFFHYLAESGLVGTSAVVALMVNQFRLSWIGWRESRLNRSGTQVILFVISLLLLVTTFIEAGWFWGQIGFIFVFFLTLIVRQYEEATGQ